MQEVPYVEGVTSGALKTRRPLHRDMSTWVFSCHICGRSWIGNDEESSTQFVHHEDSLKTWLRWQEGKLFNTDPEFAMKLKALLDLCEKYGIFDLAEFEEIKKNYIDTF